MEFIEELKEEMLLGREKRFFAHLGASKDEGSPKAVAHLPNTGSLKSVLAPPQVAWISKAAAAKPGRPERKLPWTLEVLAAPNDAMVGVNTQRANQLVKEVLMEHRFQCWQDLDLLKAEYKWSDETRFDFALVPKDSQFNNNSIDKPLTLIEVKSVTYAENGVAKFPDAVSQRARKHVRQMIQAVQQGISCELVFVVQRNDCFRFEAAEDIDPTYARLLLEAREVGVKIRAFPVEISKFSMQLVEKDL